MRPYQKAKCKQKVGIVAEVVEHLLSLQKTLVSLPALHSPVLQKSKKKKRTLCNVVIVKDSKLKAYEVGRQYNPIGQSLCDR
jgi:hypothetical protein